MAGKRFRYVQFWIRSSRGTDDLHVRKYRMTISDEELNADVQEWAEQYTLGTAIHEYSCGWEDVHMMIASQQKSEFNRLCKEKARITKAWQLSRAKLMVVDHSKKGQS